MAEDCRDCCSRSERLQCYFEMLKLCNEFGKNKLSQPKEYPLLCNPNCPEGLYLADQVTHYIFEENPMDGFQLLGRLTKN